MGTQSKRLCYDVVIVGAGYAGLAAALEIIGSEMSVVLLGRKNPFASNSAIGGGLIALTNTPLQKKNGVEDSPEFLAEDILKANRYSLSKDLAMAIAEESSQLYGGLIKIGAQFFGVIEFPGHRVPRVHLESGLNGANILRLLLNAVESQGADIRLGTIAQHLIVNTRNEVKGVYAISDGEKIEIRAKKGIILAAGGFARNKEMMAQYLPQISHLSTLSRAGSMGDGIRMGVEIGAELLNMDAAIMTSLASAKKTGYLIYGLAETLARGAILVNQRGERFVEESKGYVETALPILGQPNGEAFLVFDERIKKSTEKMETYMEKYLRDGQFLCAQTSQELAIKANIDVENFQKTINPFYPYGDLYGTWVKPAIVMTHGGLKIDANAQVIHHQGFPIPHLYAAGDNAGGLGGGPTKDSLCPGYLMGCGYLWALSSGRIAGRNVATQ